MRSAPLLLDELLLLVIALASAARHGLARRASRRRRLRLEALLQRLGVAVMPRPVFGRGGHNRTPRDVEVSLCRLCVERPDLGLRGLREALFRVAGKQLGVSTVRNVLRRNQALLAQLRLGQQQPPARIHVSKPRSLWGIDLSLVWLRGVTPLWLLAVVDYHGSQLLLLKPVHDSTEAVCVELSALFRSAGAPEAILSDNGGHFVSHAFSGTMRAHRVQHRRTRPAHPWTNGRVERLFRTFKETKRRFAPVFFSKRHAYAFCDDFLVYYNHCRPHSSYGGRTPHEVASGITPQRPFPTVSLFDGQLLAHRST